MDSDISVGGWNAPKSIGTIAKITQCKDIDLAGLQLHLETVGRSKFKINKIIPPSLEQPPNYDPYTIQGHHTISKLNEDMGVGEKMYIRAEVELIPEIDEHVSIRQWEELVDMWKNKIITLALPRVIEPHSLDHMLKQYYLATEIPTVDYIYSLSALGAKEPDELQPILEADTMDRLILRARELMTVK